MYNPEFVKACIDAKRINLLGQVLNLSHLELIMIVLNATGEVKIENCAGAVTMFEIGAYLRSIGKET